MTAILIETDTAPTLTGTITLTAAGTPLDLQGCTVYFQLRLVDERRFRINAECNIEDSTAGTVSYDLTAEDLDFTGSCQARFLVVFGDGRRQHTNPPVEVSVNPQ
jgi:baseplate upper protein BppU